MERQTHTAIFLGIMTKPVGEVIIIRLSFMAVFHPKLQSLNFYNCYL